ncbi:hypothetical protein Tco_0680416 [Tanacetum coccineum]|uniref:Uncharacterized protein n=1 Tax=Tanacetum coccineum TaxID=301880 RepID=A0ABQ4XKJ2_9ASTR
MDTTTGMNGIRSNACLTSISMKLRTGTFYLLGYWSGLLWGRRLLLRTPIVDARAQIYEIWALHYMIACRLHIALTASFAADSSMSWATDLHASDLSILIGFWLALSW